MKTLLAALLVALSLLNPACANCPDHPLTDPTRIRLKPGSPLLLVVHPSATYDARFSAKRGIDEAVRFAKARHMRVIYLQDDTPLKHYFVEDCEPDYWTPSQGGEVNFKVPPGQLYIVGGHLELCLSAALHDILYQWSRLTPHDLTVTFFMDAIYSNGKSIDPAAPYFSDFNRFMDVVTYGRPGGEHWPKLSQLETMGIIIKPADELLYLQQILPRWDTTFPESYRVELQLNDGNKTILRQSEGWEIPRLLFHFVDSALDYQPTP